MVRGGSWGHPLPGLSRVITSEAPSHSTWAGWWQVPLTVQQSVISKRRGDRSEVNLGNPGAGTARLRTVKRCSSNIAQTRSRCPWSHVNGSGALSRLVGTITAYWCLQGSNNNYLPQLQGKVLVLWWRLKFYGDPHGKWMMGKCKPITQIRLAYSAVDLQV